MLELTVANAASYLASRAIRTTAVRELGGGVSNTVLLAETGTGAVVLKQSLEKLRVEQDWFSDRGRIFRESAALTALAPHLPEGAVPRVLFEDRENCLFCMTAAHREARTWKSLLLSGNIRPSVARTIGAMLSAIMRVSWRRAEWQEQFGDQTVFDQLRIDPYYRTTAARHPDLAPSLRALLEHTGVRRFALAHGDWSPKNFLVHGDQVTAIDFEVIHYGDPSFDMAFLLNHLLLKSFYLPARRKALSRCALEFRDAVLCGLPEGAGWMEAATLEHLGWLLLARIDGKSPAEYIREEALRGQVRRYARSLIAEPPKDIEEVFESL